MKDLFRKFSHRTSELVGSPAAFITALVVLILWGASDESFISQTPGSW